MTRHRPWNLPLVALTALLLGAGPGRALEPQVAFSVKDGWVTFRLTREGKPVQDAQIKVVDGTGQVFATGDPDSTGVGEFPLPPGPTFLVEIKVGPRTSDPIRLTHAKNGLFPEQVLLSFGLAPCCRIPSRGWSMAQSKSPPPESPQASRAEWLVLLGTVGAGSLVALSVVVTLISRRGNLNPQKENDTDHAT